MIPFKDITLADKDTITSFTMKSDRRNCDLSFSNLCSWRFLYDTQFAVVDNFLVFKFWAGEQLAYMMPVGTGDLKAVLWELIEDARKENQHFCMLGVCSNMRADLEAILPEQFTFTEDRDYADYIYLRSDLSTLKGKKFQPKRNHINRQTADPEKQNGKRQLLPFDLSSHRKRNPAARRKKRMCREPWRGSALGRIRTRKESVPGISAPFFPAGKLQV